MPQDYYKILGIKRDANLEEIRSAYRALARRFHPDKNVAQGETEFFLDIQSAYEILTDPDKRAEYDSSLPREEDELSPIKISTIYSRSSLTKVDESQLLYILLELVPQVFTERENAPPLNVSLVLDVSTSMQGNILDTVKTTAIKLIRELRNQDILSIITFSDRADVLIPAGMSRDLKSVETKIQMLSTSGGTEIYQGLEKGYTEIKHFRNENNISHIILITDGRTYGDEQDCIQLAHSAADQGIGISAFGIGNKWNDIFMDELTATTGGSSIYVSKPTEILYFLTDKFTGLSRSFAQNVTLDFNFEEGVELQYAYRLQPDAAPLLVNPPVVLGTIPNNSNLNVLFEFMIKDLDDRFGDKDILRGTLSMDILGISDPRRSYKINFNRPVAIDYDSNLPPQIIVDAMSKLTLYRMQERARKEIGDGSPGKAVQRLQYLATQLLARGEAELARTVLMEVSNIRQNDHLTEDGEKQIKFGTRNLFLPEKIED